MNIYQWLVLCLIISYSSISINSLNVSMIEKANTFTALHLSNEHFISKDGIPANFHAPLESNTSTPKTSTNKYVDSLPKANTAAVIIPFEYKQSSLNYQYTFKLIDSVIEILHKDELVTLSIDGYSYFDEGSDNICYYLSVNRALAVRDYVQGRGVDSSRVIALKGLSSLRSKQYKAKKQPVEFNCTAEIILNYPAPPPVVKIQDMDEDGIADDNDGCPSEYGEKVQNGCPNKAAIIVPFESQQSSLFSATYRVMDSVVAIILNDPTLSISIEGHAYKKEGIKTVCDRLASERADIVKRYLLTRRIAASKIGSVKSFSNLRPVNPGRNPWEITRNSRVEIFLIQH